MAFVCAASYPWQTTDKQVAKFRTGHVLAGRDESSKFRGCIRGALKRIASDVLVLGDQHPSLASDHRNPFRVRSIAPEMIQMYFNRCARLAQLLRDEVPAYLMVQKKGERLEPLLPTLRGVRSGWHPGSLAAEPRSRAPGSRYCRRP